MEKAAIPVCGITPDYLVPSCPPPAYIQLCETDKLSIPPADPDIAEIVSASVKVKIRKFKILCTAIGQKLAIYATKEVQLVTKSDSVRFVSHYNIPFCAFVLLDDFDERVIGVKAIIEDIDVVQTGKRCVALSTFIMFYPHFGCKDENGCDDKSICCNISLNSCQPTNTKHLTGR